MFLSRDCVSQLKRTRGHPLYCIVAKHCRHKLRIEGFYAVIQHWKGPLVRFYAVIQHWKKKLVRFYAEIQHWKRQLVAKTTQ